MKSSNDASLQVSEEAKNFKIGDIVLTPRAIETIKDLQRDGNEFITAIKSSSIDLIEYISFPSNWPATIAVNYDLLQA